MDKGTKPEIEFIDGPAPLELVITDLIVGDGAEALPGATVDVHLSELNSKQVSSSILLGIAMKAFHSHFKA